MERVGWHPFTPSASPSHRPSAPPASASYATCYRFQLRNTQKRPGTVSDASPVPTLAYNARIGQELLPALRFLGVSAGGDRRCDLRSAPPEYTNRDECADSKSPIGLTSAKPPCRNHHLPLYFPPQPRGHSWHMTSAFWSAPPRARLSCTARGAAPGRSTAPSVTAGRSTM